MNLVFDTVIPLQGIYSKYISTKVQNNIGRRLSWQHSLQSQNNVKELSIRNYLYYSISLHRNGSSEYMNIYKGSSLCTYIEILQELQGYQRQFSKLLFV